MIKEPSPRRHIETFTSIRTGEPILVWCECPAEHDHRSGPGEPAGMDLHDSRSPPRWCPRRVSCGDGASGRNAAGVRGSVPVGEHGSCVSFRPAAVRPVACRVPRPRVSPNRTSSSRSPPHRSTVPRSRHSSRTRPTPSSLMVGSDTHPARSAGTLPRSTGNTPVAATPRPALTPIVRDVLKGIRRTRSVPVRRAKPMTLKALQTTAAEDRRC